MFGLIVGDIDVSLLFNKLVHFGVCGAKIKIIK